MGYILIKANIFMIVIKTKYEPSSKYNIQLKKKFS